MEDQINQEIETGAGAIPVGGMPSLPPKGRSALTMAIVIVVVVIATAVIAGGGVYYLNSQQSSANGDALTQLQQQLVNLNTQKTEVQKSLNNATEKLAAAELTSQSLTAQKDAQYAGWQTYTDKQYGVAWKYPAGWTVGEKEQTAMAGNKAIFCVKFTAPDNTFSLVCYRKKSDTSSTTWNRTGIGAAELTKVAANIDLAGRQITEKTLFGNNGKVLTIIYAQNIKDDETGNPARVAVGDYYFTYMADAAAGGQITPATQAVLDNILGSATLPTTQSAVQPTAPLTNQPATNQPAVQPTVPSGL